MSSLKVEGELFWQKAARGLAWRINMGWWLDRWLGWMLGTFLLGALVVLLVRWMGGIELRWVWLGMGVVVVFGAVVSWWWERERFEGVERARVRLEDALGLHARLSAAAAGVGSWPEGEERVVLPVKWRWQRLLSVLGIGGVVLMLAWWVPMKGLERDERRVIEKPTAVKEVEKWMEQVREEEAVSEVSVEAVEEKMAELLRRPAENWYEHGSLEAAGNLKEQTAEMLRELAQNLADAERAASALQVAGAGLPQAAKEALESQMGEAMQQMMAGGMKPNEQLLKQLMQNGGEGLKNMDGEQLKDLAEQLKKNSEALRKALENSPELELAQCQGVGDEEGIGQGGVDRGPGEAPLSLTRQETNLDTQGMERLQGELDVQRLAPGDVMGTTDGKHEVDRAEVVPQAGGGVKSLGDGGAAVWRDSLLPAERETLRRYFK